MDQLGTAIREARTRQGLSLRSVAASAEISPSLLSQVETGKTQPSVGTLYALVSVLGISIDELLGVQPGTTPLGNGLPEHITAPPVQRAEDNPVIEMENGVTWERLAVDGSGAVSALITRYAPGGSSSVENKLMRHSGIEYGYLIEGELTLQLEFETIVLRAGDSICFDSLRPHLYRNNTDKPAHGVWFVLGRGNESTMATPAGGFPMNSAVDVLEAIGRLPAASARAAEAGTQ